MLVALAIITFTENLGRKLKTNNFGIRLKVLGRIILDMVSYA